MNNAFFGMTIQKYICDKYSVPMHSKAVAQFEASYNSDYESGLNELTDAVFKEIGQRPKQCLTFTPSPNGKETLSPHNFILTDGTTLSIRTNKTGDKVAPRVVGQCGLPVFNTFFSELAGFEINDKEQIKGVVLQSINKMLPVFLDYLSFQITRLGFVMTIKNILTLFLIATSLLISKPNASTFHSLKMVQNGTKALL